MRLAGSARLAWGEAFLGFDGLVQAELPAAAGEHAAGGAIDDFDGSFALVVFGDDVVVAEGHELFGGEGGLQELFAAAGAGPELGSPPASAAVFTIRSRPASVRAMWRARRSSV
jgi:hypothetical protein